MKPDVQPVALEQHYTPQQVAPYIEHAPRPQLGCTDDEWTTWLAADLKLNAAHYFGVGTLEKMAVPYHVRFQYGKHAPEWYIAQKKAQNGLCAICGEKPKGKLFIDHDHATGKLRALLCVKCNSGLGMLGDSVIRILRAAAYVEMFKPKEEVCPSP